MGRIDVGPEVIGRMVREGRRRRPGMTQKQLAEQVGIEQGTISKIERGRHMPGPDYADSLAEVLGLERDFVVAASTVYYLKWEASQRLFKKWAAEVKAGNGTKRRPARAALRRKNRPRMQQRLLLMAPLWGNRLRRSAA